MNLSMHLVITQNVTNIASNNMEDYLKSEKIATKWGFAPFQYPPTPPPPPHKCMSVQGEPNLNDRINLG